ncbi:YceI family protein [Sphingomonas sp. CGMCC 1.13654]|uniref:YceI family protein n=1 Tax=Sphingomonas chungangi TaxID=2683589 RepID=A0A838LEF8_9SPHN|nr:YceI family protein [Sphingomonas chungangi]MBA2936516.1 YceI family protein [Sphingomonas chungangi]
MRAFLSALTVLATLPAAAQAPALPGAPETARVTAGTYKVEPYHTQVGFAVDHFGFSIFRGAFTGASGTLTIDPANPTKSQLSVSVPIASVQTSNPKLNEELVSADWFDAAKFPDATFVSTAITVGPNNTALVDGNLTIHGVTKPERMQVHFHGAGINPMDKVLTTGFDARIGFNRSDFGVTKYVPVVSDHVELTIAAAFEKQ